MAEERLSSAQITKQICNRVDQQLGQYICAYPPFVEGLVNARLAVNPKTWMFIANLVSRDVLEMFAEDGLTPSPPNYSSITTRTSPPAKNHRPGVFQRLLLISSFFSSR